MAKLLIYQSIYVRTLTYGHELLAVIDWRRLQTQAEEIIFLHRVAGLRLIDGVRSSHTQSEIGIELMLLRIGRSQLSWFKHLVRMPPGRLPLEVFHACQTGRRPCGRPGTHWRDYISHLSWEHLRILQEELEHVAGVKVVWSAQQSLLPQRLEPR